MSPQFAYLFIELSLVLTLAGIAHGGFQWRELTRLPLAKKASVLFGVWLVVDLTAVRIGLWHFPAVGTIAPRIFGLPLEEYLLFYLHTVLTFMLVRLFEQQSKRQ